MRDSRESTRDDDDRVRAAHLDGMREALRIVNWLRMACLFTAGPDDSRLLGIVLADYADKCGAENEGCLGRG